VKIGVIGAGRIGANLAEQWVRRGHDVVVSFKRDPEALDAVAEETGARPGTIAEAVALGDVVVISVPWSLLDDIAAGVDVAGKVVIDTTNQYAGGGLVTLPRNISAAELNAQRFNSDALVKAFNTYTSRFQTAVGDGTHERAVAMFLGGENTRAKAVVGDLVRDAGFEPVDLGDWRTVPLMEAPRRGGAVYGEEYDPRSARRIAEAAAGDLASAGRLADELKVLHVPPLGAR
jgi:8-hydroxy-5-deazaflavin:NADPH oxidoreductase